MVVEYRRPLDERTRDDAARVALIERSILVLLVVGLLIGVPAVVKPFTMAICSARHWRRRLGRYVRLWSVAGWPRIDGRAPVVAVAGARCSTDARRCTLPWRSNGAGSRACAVIFRAHAAAASLIGGFPLSAAASQRQYWSPITPMWSNS